MCVTTPASARRRFRRLRPPPVTPPTGLGLGLISEPLLRRRATHSSWSPNSRSLLLSLHFPVPPQAVPHLYRRPWCGLWTPQPTWWLFFHISKGFGVSWTNGHPP